MAAPDVKQGVFTLNTSTGNQSVTGIGFQPKVVLFKLVNKGGDGSSPDVDGCFGWAISSSSQRSMVWSADDGVGTSVVRRGWSSSRCIYLLTAGTSTIEFEATFVSQDSDGFTINITDAPAQGIKVMYLALGGSAITNVEGGNFDLSTGTGDQAVTGLSAKPDFLLLFGTLGTASSNATNSDIENMIGFASGPDNEASISWSSDSNVGSAAADRLQRTDYIFSLLDAPNGIYALAKLKSFDTSGFTLTKDTAPSSATRVQYLAITGGSWYVGAFLSQTSTGNFDVTGMGIEPSGVMMASFLNGASTSVQTDMQMVLGMATSSTARGCRGSSDEDTVVTMNNFQYLQDDHVYDHFDVSEVEQGSIDFVSFLSDGMRLNQDDADPSANQVIYFAVGDAALTITPNGIASAEAFGSLTLDLTIYPNSISSAEAFGSLTLDLTIYPNSIASAEAFGSPDIGVEQIVTLNGIASAEAFGLPELDLVIYLYGVISAEVFGLPSVVYDQAITPTGIASLEAWGSPTVNAMQTILTPTGIPSAEAWGSPTLNNQSVYIAGIVSEEAFGLPELDLVIYVGSIASEEAFGSPSVAIGSIYILPNGIPTAEAWGYIEKINQEITLEGIPSAEAFGSPSVAPSGSAFIQVNSIPSSESFGQPSVHPGITISPSSIGSSEAFGVPHVVPGGHSIVCIGIASEEAFGTPGVIVGGASIAPNSIDSSEAFGVPTLVPQFVSVHPIGIESGETFGTSVVATGNVSISVNSIVSSEAFGTPSLSPGNVFFSPSSITSQEAFGAPSLSVGAVDITPNSILPSEAWGLPNISISINPNSILSEEAFGSPSISTGNVNIDLIGISSEEGFGEPIVRNVLVIEGPVGIVSEEAFGLPTIFLRVLSPFQEQMETDLDEVFFTDDDFEFAEYAVFTYDTGEVIPLKVIFDHAYEEVTPGGAGAMVQSRNPMVQCQTSVFTRRPRKGCKLQVRGTNYEVMSYEPDGTGVSTLMLHHEKTV